MEVAGSLDSKSRSEVDERNVKKCKKRSNKSAQKTLSPEHNGDVKVDITTMKSRTVIVDSSPHAISAEKIVRKTLMEVGGSCSAKKMREVLRSKLGMKKVKAILAEVSPKAHTFAFPCLWLLNSHSTVAFVSVKIKIYSTGIFVE